jgi:hypothetical protein
MFCKNCGAQINPNAVACLSCGCDPRRGNKHCNSCGVETNADQVICIKCGVALKKQSLSSDDGKTVAIISYLTLIGFIIAIIQHGSNKTRLGAYHLRQVVGFMVTGVGLAILLWLITFLMFYISYRSIAFIRIISFIVWIGLLVSIIVSFINAVNGKEKPAPVFGKLYEKWFSNMFN